MFEIRCVVPTTKIGDFLMAIQGHVVGQPTITRVNQPKAVDPSPELYKRVKPRKRSLLRKDGKRPLVGGRGQKGKGVTELVRTQINASSRLHVASKDMRRICEAAGYGKGSYSHAIKLLVAEGILKPLPTLGDYEIIRKPQAA